MLSFGQLFGSNFWSSFKSQPSESIEKLLKKEDCKIEDLLDDNDLLQECKNSNKNLINYLRRDKIKELIDLITVMPEEDEHNRGHKYPFLASEVFNCDIVTDMFFTAPCDDKKDEPEEPAEEDDDANKFDSNYEKDQDDSSSDSDDDDHHKDDFKDAHDHAEDEDGDVIVEDINTDETEGKSYL